MELGKKIYELRKKNNITQEQLARAVGVSTPAVCKWETGVSMPDIGLLAPIARKLNTNIDDLLSFQETLSENEIKDITNRVKEAAREKGLDAGMELGYEFLRRFPNVEALKLQVAMLPVMMAHTAGEEYWQEEDKFQRLMDETTGMLEELTNSNVDTVRMTAIITIAVRYMEQKRFDEAEVMLKRIPDQTFDTRHLYPSLYQMKGEDEKVFQSAQANMLQDIQHLLTDIQVQHTQYLKQQEYDKALKCARDYLTLVHTAGISGMCGNELLVNTYLAMDRIDDAVNYFLDYIDEIMKISGDNRNSFYYSSIAKQVVIASPDVEEDVRASLYQHLLRSERFHSLRQKQVVEQKLNQLKRMLQHNNTL